MYIIQTERYCNPTPPPHHPKPSAPIYLLIDPKFESSSGVANNAVGKEATPVVVTSDRGWEKRISSLDRFTPNLTGICGYLLRAESMARISGVFSGRESQKDQRGSLGHEGVYWEVAPGPFQVPFQSK